MSYKLSFYWISVQALILLCFIKPPLAYAEPCLSNSMTLLPIRTTGYYLTLNANIQHKNISLIVDTGSEGSLLTQQALAYIKLSPDPLHHTFISGSDNTSHLVPNITLGDLHIGPLSFKNITFPIGELPGFPNITPPVMGLIGMDILQQYDLLLDVPHGTLTLWCPSLIRQNQPSSARLHSFQPVHTLQHQGRFYVPFILDGHSGIALIDSGARSRIIGTHFAHLLGLSNEQLARDPGGISSGISSSEQRYYWHRFHHLTLGPTSERHPVLTITTLNDQVDMLLGADWLSQHSILLSSSTHTISIQNSLTQ